MATWQSNPGAYYHYGREDYCDLIHPSGGSWAYSGVPPATYLSAPAYQTIYSDLSRPTFVTYDCDVPAPQPAIKNRDLEQRISGFGTTTLRQTFVRKVYLILTLQLLVIFATAASFAHIVDVNVFARRHVSLAYVCASTTLLLAIIISCCPRIRRMAPLNYVFLTVFTIAESLIAGFIASADYESHVLVTVGVTGAICITLTLFSLQTRLEFLGFGIYFFISGLALMIFGIAQLVCNHHYHPIWFHCTSGALLFSFYLIYDTQLMLSGDHVYATLSPGDYVFAALNLHLDFVNVFLYLFNIMRLPCRS
ncbi:protein lifeguard 1-like [Copidosoma floridanum]|uniref:protein lifeguard 1-like n=1 Tax=Copidosoma floridanum TaxID=29053 RepID=UPI0006C9845F|nr:protein lifeguard 1-like [Copidosoma floridanum]